MTTALHPNETVADADYAAPESAERIGCPKCDKTYAGGAIVRGSFQATPGGCRRFDQNVAVWSERHQCFVLQCRLYCDHCHVLHSWLEAADAVTHEPLGLVLEGPGSVSGRATVARFLSQFPRAAGVQHPV